MGAERRADEIAEGPAPWAVDAIVVGAGFAGLYALHRLRGLGLSALVLERAHGVGGTWYWNRYPGARCDVESLQYSYQFSEELQQAWVWTERYAAQPELLRYAEHVAERFDLLRDIRFDRTVTSARFDEAASRWLVETEAGDRFSARYCIMATGCLSVINRPKVEGLERFQGEVLHTGDWPHSAVSFLGKRVGVIGTGSSAIQSIPIIAESADHLTVFQRTPNYAVPAHNAPLDPKVQAAVKANYAALRARAKTTRNGIDFPIPTTSALGVSAAEREAAYEERWALGGLSFMTAFDDLLVEKRANDTLADFIRRKIRGIVEDRETADLLSPDSIVGCKRLCVDSGYYRTFNRANVTLVDISQRPIEQVAADGVVVDGAHHRLDMLILATGFDAMTGALDRIAIHGRGGQSLSAKWADGPKTYLGLAVAGFPNLFTITGPGSPSVLTNMLPTIEQHVDWISDCIAYLEANDIGEIEASADAEAAWVDHVGEVAGGLLYPHCHSWYLGANVPGKPRVFMPYPGFPPYVEKCREVAAAGYRGFTLIGRA
ncbi:MAG: NAD(P)/FAD-dependent oxidoreductase [Alphaproteobacteria bacterium]|nr:NAD(P)/FAD-dependent oxidoreductase [Alphaproteobacteria bacterium]